MQQDDPGNIHSLASKCPLVDIGANLSHAAFSHDLDRVIADAQAAGVGHIIATGTDLESTAAALGLADKYTDFLSVTAGFHPHIARQFNAAALETLRNWLGDPRVVAVGETGLDFNRDFSPRDIQQEVFEQQLQLAVEMRKPVFLHQRDAHAVFHPMLREYRAALTAGVVHCFTDDRAALFDYLDLDMYIGITGWICDERRGRGLQELVSSIPPDRLLIETDSPYLLPRSLRPLPKSRRNEPKFLLEVLHALVQCTGRPAELLARQCSENACRLFGIKLLA
jgi:TatD DNase family protein